MRRSATVRLTLLSAASLALVACGEDPEPPQAETLFSSEAACRQAFRGEGDAACAAAFAEASAAHLATAPRFPDQAGCEAETGGRCEVVGKPGFASYAMPAMAGVLLGRVLADGSRGVLPVYGGPPPPGCAAGQPPSAECPPRSSSSSPSSGGGRGNYYFGSNYVGHAEAQGQARGFTPSARGSQALMATPAPAPGSVARGGLGSAGRAFSSVGS
jgi:hypothetical protein